MQAFTLTTPWAACCRSTWCNIWNWAPPGTSVSMCLLWRTLYRNKMLKTGRTSQPTTRSVVDVLKRCNLFSANINVNLYFQSAFYEIHMKLSQLYANGKYPFLYNGNWFWSVGNTPLHHPDYSISPLSLSSLCGGEEDTRMLMRWQKWRTWHFSSRS